MKIIGKTADGALVVDRPNSHLHDKARKLIAEAIGKITAKGKPFITEEVDFGWMIGLSDCVTTEQHDVILFARRRNRIGLTRFVAGRDPQETSLLTVVLKRADGPQKYVLITAFIGGKAEPEPWDANATPDTFEFWKKHALIWGTQDIVDGTATIVCPW